ncbi:hypothetical protein K3495_g15157 [Podosphaera aphanis]|nr:hypothetical protein K3495_g15157 [Podosphaera aphanis]
MSSETTQLLHTNDASASFLNLSCLDFLMIELVPMAYRVANDVVTIAQQDSDKMDKSAADLRKMDEDEEKDAVFLRLEALGYRVGQGLVERFSRERPRFTDTLDVIKFICKDLWIILFRKQLDNLKTNHRGVYVLTDNSFRPFTRMSTEPGGQAIVRAQPFLWFPCGIIRGALANMGIDATVQAESNELPGASFQIKSAVKS